MADEGEAQPLTGGDDGGEEGGEPTVSGFARCTAHTSAISIILLMFGFLIGSGLFVLFLGLKLDGNASRTWPQIFWWTAFADICIMIIPCVVMVALRFKTKVVAPSLGLIAYFGFILYMQTLVLYKVCTMF
jgi:hypothetical protein